MNHSEIQLTTPSKSFQFEKLSRDIDKIDDLEVLREMTKCHIVVSQTTRGYCSIPCNMSGKIETWFPKSVTLDDVRYGSSLLENEIESLCLSEPTTRNTSQYVHTSKDT